MSTPIPRRRVLIVDDSIVTRRALARIVEADAGWEVMAAVGSGAAALARLRLNRPDVVLLDVEMPDMDGLATLEHIRRDHPEVPVVMCSALTSRGGAVTLEALARGAVEYVTKPSARLGADLAIFGHHLAAVLNAVVNAAQRRHVPAVALRSVTPPPPLARAGGNAVAVVAIGVSTGGPNALARLLPGLPADLPVPVLIVQHMPAAFTPMLAQRLAAVTALDVREAVDGEALEAGTVYLAPGDRHMEVTTAGLPRVSLHQGPPENSCRPAVDVLLRTVAASFGARALAVILTGMGQDGLRGCEAVRAAGGVVLAQDEATSVVWGMPGFVVGAGLADQVVPLERMARAILARVAGRIPSRVPGDVRP